MELHKKFSGTGVAIVTPFLQDGKIDWESFEKIINHIISGNCNYIVVLGTTGESATIHGAEKQEVFSFVNKITANRLSLVAGIGGNDTQEVLYSLQKFDLTGYEAILSVSPFYNKPNQEGIFQHYKLIDAATPLPIIMYNVPGRTGQNMTAATQLRIAKECKNIFATKEASGNFEQIMQLIKNKPHDFMVISGDDGITLPMISCGAAGVISVVANAYPHQFSEMVRKCMENNYEAARKIHYQFTEIIDSMFAEGSPSGVKAYLGEMNLCKNYFRNPVYSVSEEHLKKIKTLMKLHAESIMHNS